MSTSTQVTLREVLLQQAEYRGWLYLPDSPLSLDTLGYFVQFNKDEDPTDEGQLPEQVRSLSLRETIDAPTVEDIVINARQQLGSPSLEQLLQALVYYVENDAFMRFATK